MPIGVAIAFKHFDRHELHSASSMASSTRHAVQLLYQVQVHQSSFRGFFGREFGDDDVIFRDIPVKNLAILEQRPMTSNSIAERLQKLSDRLIFLERSSSWRSYQVFYKTVSGAQLCGGVARYGSCSLTNNGGRGDELEASLERWRVSDKRDGIESRSARSWWSNIPQIRCRTLSSAIMLGIYHR